MFIEYLGTAKELYNTTASLVHANSEAKTSRGAAQEYVSVLNLFQALHGV